MWATLPVSARMVLLGRRVVFRWVSRWVCVAITSNADDMWSILQADSAYDPFPEYIYLGEGLDDGTSRSTTTNRAIRKRVATISPVESGNTVIGVIGVISGSVDS
jgi:hypothetical protein